MSNTSKTTPSDFISQAWTAFEAIGGIIPPSIQELPLDPAGGLPPTDRYVIAMERLLREPDYFGNSVKPGSPTWFTRSNIAEAIVMGAHLDAVFRQTPDEGRYPNDPSNLLDPFALWGKPRLAQPMFVDQYPGSSERV
jgi:hypothetical protein